MKAAVIHDFVGIEDVKIEEIKKPIPLDNEVQIGIKYAGVNPVDWKIADGYLKGRMPHQFPVILGWEMSGIVTAKGKNVKNLKEGDAVFAYCRKQIMQEGTFAEYICYPAENVVPMPKNLSFEQAAGVPLAGLAAWQSLHEAAQLKSKQTILIQAGAGGVGSYGLQYAHLAGAFVITTCSPSNFEYVKQLGANEVIDYTKQDFAEVILKKYPQGVDVVFDTVGGESLKKSYSIVKKGGRLVGIVETLDQQALNQRNINGIYVFVRPDGKQLQQIADLFEAGKLKPPHVEAIPLKDVVLALRKLRDGHVRGKLVLTIS